MAVAIVFEPMVSGDDREAAVAEAGRFADPRAQCFWDAEHFAARTWGAAQRKTILPKLLAVTPPDAPWRAELETWDPEQRPLWDVAWFFGPRASWPADGLPEQAAWARQFQYMGGADDRANNGFFRGDGQEAGIAWSKWSEQFEAGMDAAR